MHPEYRSALKCLCTMRGIPWPGKGAEVPHFPKCTRTDNSCNTIWPLHLLHLFIFVSIIFLIKQSFGILPFLVEDNECNANVYYQVNHF